MTKQLYPPNSKHKNSYSGPDNWRRSSAATFEQVLAGQFDNRFNGDYEAIRETPVRSPSIETDILVPLGQSLVTSLVISLNGIAVSLTLGIRWEYIFLMGTIGATFSWFHYQSKSENSLIKVESFSYTATGQETASVAARQSDSRITLEVRAKEGDYSASYQFIDLPQSVTDDKFKEYAIGILGARSMARREWTGPQKLFSRDEYDALMDAMMTAGLVKTLPGKGRVLTKKGQLCLAQTFGMGEKGQYMS